MPIEQVCRFKKSYYAKEKYEKSFLVYQIGEPDLPKHRPKQWIHNNHRNVELGEYLETWDGYIAPVIRNWEGYLRIASPVGSRYSKYGLKNKTQFLLFKPPKNYHHRLRGFRKRLTPEERSFCWQYAKHGNGAVAMQESEFNLNYAAGKSYASTLLKHDKIREGIMNAFREQVKFAGGKEAEFVVDRLVRMQDDIEEIVRNLKSKIKEDISQDEMNFLLQTLKLNHDIIKNNSELLGYTREESGSFSIRGRFKHQLPAQKPMIEEADASEV